MYISYFNIILIALFSTFWYILDQFHFKIWIIIRQLFAVPAMHRDFLRYLVLCCWKIFKYQGKAKIISKLVRFTKVHYSTMHAIYYRGRVIMLVLITPKFKGPSVTYSWAWVGWLKLNGVLAVWFVNLCIEFI